ncbi:unnamed protein product [Rotaria sp. Silwood1]|nr:unnamed protein product [Rotaria sp. Silwood1]
MYSNSIHNSSVKITVHRYLLQFETRDVREFLNEIVYGESLVVHEDDTYSKPVTFDLQSLFESIKASNSTIELKLSANLLLTDMQRLN